MEGVELAALAAECAARTHDEVLRVESLCLQGLLECLVGRPEAAATLRQVAELAGPAAYGRVLSTPIFNRGVFALWTDGPEAAELLRDAHDDAVARGDEGSVPMVLAQLALAEYLAGRWAEAAQVAEEASEFALQTGQRPMQAYSLATRALVRASLGLEAEARADADRALALAGERGMAAAQESIASGRSACSSSRSTARPRPSACWLLSVTGSSRPAWASRARCDSFPTRSRRWSRWGERTRRRPPFAGSKRERGFSIAPRHSGPQRAAAACWPLRGEKATAAHAAFERALTEHARITNPFERARTLLAFGAAQRRAKKKSAARETLGDALATFETLGAALWANKARAELRSIGGRAPSTGELTPAEERVAALVAEGHTNREVAALLFVTDHTVEFHLSRIYRKLGVRSRAELARRFHD